MTIKMYSRPLEERFKYPKTMHLPWSPGLQNDDRVIESLAGFLNETLVITEKMDGENTTLYNDCIHARSMMDMSPHPSRNLIKELHSQIKHLIPYSYRICGENLFAKHSIHYKDLKDYFQVFSIWDNKYNHCLSWRDTILYCELLGLSTVPVLEHSWINKLEDLEKECSYISDNLIKGKEGYVVRISKSFNGPDFQKVVAKYVRKNHVQTSNHWLTEVMVKNETL